MPINGKKINLDKLEIKIVDDANRHVLANLGQAYEAEFSPLTEALPNEDGLYALETAVEDSYIGYLLYYHATPLGFCIVNIGVPNDVAEFYIIPAMRREKLGNYLATQIFDMHRGLWQVRQIQGAQWATDFWRNTIKGYGKEFSEDIISDPDYGEVIRQTFHA